MAGVQRQKDSKGKWRYRVQFYDPTGKRHSVWLGRVSHQVAKEVAGHIENLVDAGKYSTTVPTGRRSVSRSAIAAGSALVAAVMMGARESASERNRQGLQAAQHEARAPGRLFCVQCERR